MINFAVAENIALKKHTNQSSVCNDGYSSRAVDGKASNTYASGSCTHTCEDPSMWWMVDFGQSAIVHFVNITNRGRFQFHCDCILIAT